MAGKTISFMYVKLFMIKKISVLTKKYIGVNEFIYLPTNIYFVLPLWCDKSTTDKMNYFCYNRQCSNKVFDGKGTVFDMFDIHSWPADKGQKN